MIPGCPENAIFCCNVQPERVFRRCPTADPTPGRRGRRLQTATRNGSRFLSRRPRHFRFLEDFEQQRANPVQPATQLASAETAVSLHVFDQIPELLERHLVAALRRRAEFDFFLRLDDRTNLWLSCKARSGQSEPPAGGKLRTITRLFSCRRTGGLQDRRLVNLLLARSSRGRCRVRVPGSWAC